MNGPEAKPVAAEDVAGSVRITEATLSNDAQRIAYVGDASGQLNLWMMPSAGGAAQALVHVEERQAQPVFSHDDRQVVYMQDRGGDEMYDLLAVDVATRQTRNLTHSEDASEYGPLFSPDGSRLVMIRKPKGSPTPNLAWLRWPDGPVQTLTSDTDPKANWTPVSFSPDGRYLYANRVALPDDSDIFRIKLDTGVQENLTRHPGHQRMRLTDISPDGQTLLATSNEQGGYDNVLLMSGSGGQRRWVTHTQWQAQSGSFAPDARSFSYTVNADGRKALKFVRVDSLVELQRQIPEGLNEAGAYPRSFLPNGDFLLLHQDAMHPANLYVSTPTQAAVQITHNESAGLAAASLPNSQVVTYRSFDGQLISAFVWIPLNLPPRQQAAAVLLPHGGPTDQTIDEFNRRALMLVSRGIVVLAPNVRGSTGYGTAFELANRKDLGGADLKDEIAGLEFLVSTGLVDRRRIGIWGGSYGGFMTLMAVGKRPDLWAAAVDEYGILDWQAMLRRSEPELQEYEKSLLGDPVRDRAIYEKSSPLQYLHHAQAPILVLQGERDIRVPKQEAEQVVALLKADGKVVEAAFYPDEGHGFVKRATRIDELNRATRWFEKYLAPKP